MLLTRPVSSPSNNLITFFHASAGSLTIARAFFGWMLKGTPIQLGMTNRDIVEKIEKDFDQVDETKWYQICLMLLARAQG